MSRRTSGLIPDGGVIGRLPFEGEWLTEVSPTRRVPSHGTDLFGTTYAFDFLAVDVMVARRLRAACARSSPQSRQSSSTPSGAPCTHPLQELWCLLTTANPTMRRAAPC